MAAKVGGIYVSLALNTAEFSGGVDKSVAEMRKFDKLQTDMAKSVDRVTSKLGQQATVVGQLALQGTKFGPVVSLLASNMQQYYEAMSRAAAGNAAFSKSGAALAASIKTIQANWVTLTIVIAQTAIDKIIAVQLERAKRVADQARAAATAMEKTVSARRAGYARELQDELDARLGIEKKITVAEIAETAVRTKNYARARVEMEKFVISEIWRLEGEAWKRRVAREKDIADQRRNIAHALMTDQQRTIADINSKYDDLIEKAGMFGTVGEFWANKRALDEKRHQELQAAGLQQLQTELEKVREKEEFYRAQQARWDAEDLAHSQKIVAAWQKKIDLARRYAGLVTGRGAGAYSAMLGSAEAFGRIPGVPGGITAAQSPAMNFNTDEINRHLRIIARAAEKELRL